MPQFNRKKQGSEVLPGADPEQDCPTAPEDLELEQAVPLSGGATIAPPADDHDDDDHEHDVNWRELAAAPGPASAVHNWLPQRSRTLHFLERVALAVERPWNRLSGTVQLNPFYHTGTIAFFLLLIVGLTGFYLFLFFQYGFDSSYNAILTRLEGQFIGRTARAIHRYASGALVITTLLHAYRTLFMARFRGPRWLAWLTGIVMTILLWLAGVTGYWLIWDERAQLMTERFVAGLEPFGSLADCVRVLLVNAAAADFSWPIFLAVFAIHLLLFLIALLFFWLHIRRLSRARWLPPVYWIVGVGVVVVIIGAIFPAGMLPQGSFTALPGPIRFDPLFLFYLPLGGSRVAAALFWGGLLLATLFFAALPWLSRSRRAVAAAGEAAATISLPASPTPSPAVLLNGPPKVNIIKERCTGCTKCALDCPYGAITMVERHDDKPHKFIALENVDLCVSCGICVGSCDGVAVTLGDTPPEMLWQTVAARLERARAVAPTGGIKVVFTCERHAAQGGLPYVRQTTELPDGRALEVVTLPCVGAAPPDLLSRTLDHPAVDEVQVVGCPPDDCVNREGNLWAEQRLTRERVPRLRREYANAPITAAWLPPNDFGKAVAAPPAVADAPVAVLAAADEDEALETVLARRRMYQELTPRNFIVAFLLLALVMVAQIFLTNLPFTAYPDPPAVVDVVLADLGTPLGRASYIATTLGPQLTLQLESDGTVIHEETLPTVEILTAETFPFAHRQQLAPGPHALRLRLVDPATATVFLLFSGTPTVEAGEIFLIAE